MWGMREGHDMNSFKNRANGLRVFLFICLLFSQVFPFNFIILGMSNLNMPKINSTDHEDVNTYTEKQKKKLKNLKLKAQYAHFHSVST